MLIVEIKVIPSSGKSDILLSKNGTITAYLKSPPEDGKANKELISLLSDKLSVPRLALEIVMGLTGRKKRIKIDRPLTMAQLYSTLGFEQQNSFDQITSMS